MKRLIACCVAITSFTLGSAAYADWLVANQGTWPESWPKELEPLRNQSRSMEGGLVNLVVHQISFTRRGEFEAAWPHLLKLKSKGAPIVLVRGPKEGFMELKPAGVIFHCPPRGSREREEPIAGTSDISTRWIHTNYIELVVDGLVVDLNRIPLPANTPIIDQRFNSDKARSTKQLPEPRDRPNDD